MIVFAVIATIVIGFVAAVFGNDLMNGFTDLGTIFAVAVMGGFILYAIRKNDIASPIKHAKRFARIFVAVPGNDDDACPTAR